MTKRKEVNKIINEWLNEQIVAKKSFNDWKELENRLLEWHAKQIEPIAKTYKKYHIDNTGKGFYNFKFNAITPEYVAEMWNAIKQVAEGER